MCCAATRGANGAGSPTRMWTVSRAAGSSTVSATSTSGRASISTGTSCPATAGPIIPAMWPVHRIMVQAQATGHVQVLANIAARDGQWRRDQRRPATVRMPAAPRVNAPRAKLHRAKFHGDRVRDRSAKAPLASRNAVRDHWRVLPVRMRRVRRRRASRRSGRPPPAGHRVSKASRAARNRAHPARLERCRCRRWDDNANGSRWRVGRGHYPPSRARVPSITGFGSW